MSSPIPPDPYAALGVSKDADLSAIRTAHRKLVLKFHPDRIKDAALKEKGKNEFQKIQQAYELLSDSPKRSRYDDQVKLAELRRQAMMMRDAAPRPTTYPMRHGPPPPPRSTVSTATATTTTPKSSAREFREDGRFYEERVPSGSSPSYFDSKDSFEEPLRTTSRKFAEYERKPSSSSKSAEKEKKTSTAGLFATAAAASFGVRLKREVDSKKAKLRERDGHAAKKEARDREKRKDRNEKQDRRSPYVADVSDSDSDTATRVTTSTIRPTPLSPRFSQGSEPPKKRYSAPSRKGYSEEDDSEPYDQKWERLHATGKEYIGRASNRPVYSRSSSDIYDYWVPKSAGSGRKSGSDSERRPTSSRGRDSYEESPLRPHLPTQSSAPSNLRPHVEERTPNARRSAPSAYSKRDRDRDRDREREREREREPERDQRSEAPLFARSQTMPSPRTSSKKDNAPSKGSHLKHAETQDSGYSSGSIPHTPEMREESPVRGSRGQQTSTKYQVFDPDNENERRRPSVRVNKILTDDRRFQSPEPDHRRREKSDRPDRPRADGQARPRSSRDSPSTQDSPGPPPMRRAESSRYESRTARESPSLSRNNSARDKLFCEVPGDEADVHRHQRQYSTEKVSTAPRYADIKLPHQRRGSQDQRSHDYAHGSRFEADLRHPEMGSRRGSVY